MKKNLFEVRGLGKDFGGNSALRDISMDIRYGEILGLVGENGAGKSTLLKTIMGVHPPSRGEMRMRDGVFAPKNPKEANQHGIGMVFQEQSLIINLTVGQNIFFGEEKRFTKGGLIRYKDMYSQAKKVLEEVDLDIRPDKYVRELNFASRQMVEIAKVVNQAYACAHEHALILLDEPTSVLNDSEIRQLFAQVRKLAENGHSIIFVSHRLDEVLEITERIYVFKDAQKVGEFTTANTDEKMLYEAMVGKTSSSEYYNIHLQKDPGEEIVLETKDLGLFGTFKDVSFQLHRGEILGFCGVVGSGKEELCEALCGDIKPTAGEILVKGKPVKLAKPSAALDASILMIPQERNIEGIVGILSVADNIAASSLRFAGKWGLVSRKKIAGQAKKWIERLRIKTPSYKTTVNNLSGGNAQKVVFAKMLSSRSDIILLNHPTRGVDVGAKEEIYHLIRGLIDEGKSLILLGDTLDECIGLSNRILVMKDGLITGEFDASVGSKPEHMDIIQCMM